MDEKRPETRSLLAELLALLGETGAQGGHYSAKMAVAVKRALGWLGALGLLGFVLAVAGAAAGSAGMVTAAVFVLAIATALFLVIAAPVGVALKAASDKFAPVRGYLKAIGVVLLWAFLVAVLLRIVPGIMNAPGALLTLVLAMGGMAMLSIVYGVGARPGFIYFLLVAVVVITLFQAVSPGLDSALKELPPRVGNAVSGSLRDMELPGERISLLSLDTIAELDRYAFFNARGEPRAWFAHTGDGGYEWFGAPGRHPRSNVVLRPVTPDAIAAHRRFLDRRAGDVQRARVFHRGKGGGTAIAVYVDGGLGLDSGNVQRIVLEGVQDANRRFFTAMFPRSGTFRSALRGDTSSLRALGVFDEVERVLLASLEGDCGPNPYRPDFATCRMSWRYRLLDGDGATIDQGRETATSAGFNRDDAAREGLLQLAEKYGER